MINRQHSLLSVARQCVLLEISRSGLYYQPVGDAEEDLAFMKLIDRQYLDTPFYGARRMSVWLKRPVLSAWLLQLAQRQRWRWGMRWP